MPAKLILPVFTAEETASHLAVLGVELPGDPIKAAHLPTDELLVVVQTGDAYGLYLVSGSDLVPYFAVVTDRHDHSENVALMFYAFKLLDGDTEVTLSIFEQD